MVTRIKVVEVPLKKNLSNDRKTSLPKGSSPKVKKQEQDIALDNAQDKSPDDLEIYD